MTTYILKKECRNIGKEAGDYYNGEYGESPEKIKELIEKGVIEIEYECETCQDTGEVTTDVFDNDSHRYQPTGTGRCPDCMGEDDADFSGATEGDR